MQTMNGEVTHYAGMKELNDYSAMLKRMAERFGFFNTRIQTMNNDIIGLITRKEKLQIEVAKLEGQMQTRMGMAEAEIKKIKGMLADEINKTKTLQVQAKRDAEAAKRDRANATALLAEAEGIRKQQLVIKDVAQRKVAKK